MKIVFKEEYEYLKGDESPNSSKKKNSETVKKASLKAADFVLGTVAEQSRGKVSKTAKFLRELLRIVSGH